MNYTYLISTLLMVSDYHALVAAAFPTFNGEPVLFDGNSKIRVTFATPQTPADLGPLVRVELLPND
jgi:hypothetical protein